MIVFVVKPLGEYINICIVFILDKNNVVRKAQSRRSFLLEGRVPYLEKHRGIGSAQEERQNWQVNSI